MIRLIICTILICRIVRFIKRNEEHRTMKTKNKFIIAGALVVLFGALLACGSTSANTGTVVTPSASKSTTTPAKAAAPQMFKVGQTVKIGDWNVIVKSVTDAPGGAYLKPTNGTYLEVTVQATNTGSQEQTMSSVINWSMRDKDGQTINETIVSDDNGKTTTPPDGKVEAGQPIQGVLSYDVAKGQKFTLSFAPSITDPGQTTWEINS